jgi:hypothetical protein
MNGKGLSLRTGGVAARSVRIGRFKDGKSHFSDSKKSLTTIPYLFNFKFLLTMSLAVAEDGVV